MIRYILFVAGFGLVYHLYAPLPSESPEPWKLQTLVIFSKLMYMAADFMELIGYESSLNVTRWQMGFLHKGDADDEQLHITNDKFDGVTVRIYKPINSNGRLLPGVIFYPGCGFTMNGLDMHHTHSILLAKGTNAIVVAAQHRLAPENPFPAGMEDSVAVMNYVMKHARTLGIDRNRVGVIGDSSGGQVSLSVALQHKTNDKDLPDLKFLVMLYPGLQLLDLKLLSYKMFDRHDSPTFISNQRALTLWLYYVFGFEGSKYVSDFLANNHTHVSLAKSDFVQYVSYEHLHNKLSQYRTITQKLGRRSDILSETITRKITNPYVAGLMASDKQIQRLPPTYHLTCEYDMLLHEDLMFNSRLQKQGIDLVHRHFKGYPHGFIIPIFVLDGALQAWMEIIEYINDRL